MPLLTKIQFCDKYLLVLAISAYCALEAHYKPCLELRVQDFLSNLCSFYCPLYQIPKILSN
jgi:hypothetical protein